MVSLCLKASEPRPPGSGFRLQIALTHTAKALSDIGASIAVASRRPHPASKRLGAGGYEHNSDARSWSTRSLAVAALTPVVSLCLKASEPRPPGSGFRLQIALTHTAKALSDIGASIAVASRRPHPASKRLGAGGYEHNSDARSWSNHRGLIAVSKTFCLASISQTEAP